MRYLALAVDYDGTAALDDRLSDSAAVAIERLRVSGRRAVLVTGRRVSDLLRVCPRLDLFDLIVAENGAVLYDPRQRDEIPLASPLLSSPAQTPSAATSQPLVVCLRATSALTPPSFPPHIPPTPAVISTVRPAPFPSFDDTLSAPAASTIPPAAFPDFTAPPTVPIEAPSGQSVSDTTFGPAPASSTPRRA